ncbi:hypothetical protein LH464_04430 [Neorhizobium sp. T786]|uniref:hypothetical protein n=1 Tax=Pseudorhizobium xiangyangii TaxID=2883104 RepID=UPI001CFFE92F|nr:hypothetical protein [Neorhizobium xiangyangii]MCB5201725.1 hypothetical protein [Neorhizobium xiangyangii]
MEIVNFGHFTTHQRDGFLFHTNEDGQDWYELRNSLTTWAANGEFIDSIYGAWVTVTEKGVVANVEYDPSRIVPDNKTVLGVDADVENIRPGMLYSDAALRDPPAPTIEEVRASMPSLTPREFRDTLIDNGIMPSAVTAVIEQIGHPVAQAKAMNAWEYNTQFVRTDPLVDQLATAFGLTPEDVDQMWGQALSL